MPCAVSSLFDIRYGHSLELNALKVVSRNEGVAFFSRKLGQNGVSAYVEPIEGVAPALAGEVTCALGGNPLATYLQESNFYCGRDVAILSAKASLTKQQILFYCLCIHGNKFRYNYGRQANKTLQYLLVPSIDEIPPWVNSTSLNQIDGANGALNEDGTEPIVAADWKVFTFHSLFEIKKGKRLTKNDMQEGTTPFIGAIDSNNGHRQHISVNPDHPANTITVNYNGNGVAEAFYQQEPYFASDDVNVLYPKFSLNLWIGMFLCTLIRQEKYRFNYGRKWHLGRMNESTIKLPTKADGKPDFDFMENYVKSLPYSKSI